MRATPALLVLFTALTAVCPLRSQSPEGTWIGSIELPTTPLAVTVELHQKDSVWSGTIDIPQQNAHGLPLEGIAIHAKDVQFAIKDVPGDPTFRGKLELDAASLKGTFSQGGQEFPFALALDKAGAAALTAKLDGFAAWLDGTRAMFDVPGCAVAIVRRGKLEATFASGMRDQEKKLPVTADTLFAIGSCTKAFTTATLATLVDEGKLDWDETVRTVIPEFALSDAAVGERLTVRDLVTHRSGMPRHDLVWYGATFERAEMVKRLRFLPLNHDLRTDFQYNNLMFLCAGHVAERVAGRSWEELVRSRILQPLGMSRSNFSVVDSEHDPDHAEPYGMDEKKVTHLPFRNITAIGPAGSINSSVNEMSHWVMLHLLGGEVDGKRVLAAPSMDDLHRVRMPIADTEVSRYLVEVGYALGWFVDVYRGHRRVQHGGNIDGFSALVAMLPEDGIGFVVLTNMDGSGLPELIVRDLSDRILGLETHDWRGEAKHRRDEAMADSEEGKAAAKAERRTGTSPSHPLEDYVGEYLDPGYGRCKVELRDGALHVDFHGIGARMEHWHYDVFRCVHDAPNAVLDDTKVQFTTDFDGDIDALRAVLDANVPAIVFRRQPDSRLRDPAFLANLAGDYEVGGRIANFLVQGDTLVVTLPGQRYELVPGRGLVFQLKGLNGFSVRFVLDEKGRATAAMFRQPDGVHESKRRT